MKWRATVVALAIVAGTQLVPVAGEDNVQPKAGDVNAGEHAMQDLVKAEVERQLAPAVQQEVKRQLAALIRDAQAQSRPRAVASILQTLRSQLELYKIQHEDKFPAFSEFKDWKALSDKTDSAGHYGLAKPFGPYLRGLPVNPYTGKSAVATAGQATADAGWTWDEQKGVLRVVVPATMTKEAAPLGDDVEVVK